MRILTLTPDLFFSTRIRSALEQAGHTVRLVEAAEEVSEAMDELGPALVVLDIGAAGSWPWEDILRDLHEQQPELPILAFGSHMDVEATKQAQTLGATRVVARSEFVNNMANLVERYGRERGG
jgi:DNA-binding NtrC family response regulator